MASIEESDQSCSVSNLEKAFFPHQMIDRKTIYHRGAWIMAYRYSPAIDRLLARKAAIEERISSELKRPLPDSVALQSLKRQRLSLKDRAARLMSAERHEMMPIPVRIG